MNYKYRADVDGLRAVAVVLVILFHAGLGFTGGYIGVDVFFVISGFLITGLILKASAEDRFSLKDFWMRRIRRILPASTFMVVVTLLAGLLLLWPPDFVELAKSSIAQQLMLSNVYFSKSTGYFSGPSDLMPLLHTWSLAVEEQFYLVYPLALWFLYRRGKSWMLTMLVVLFAGSLILSIVRVHHASTFYLLPGRAWEMLLGGLLCFLPAPSRWDRRILSTLSVLGLVAIFASAIFYTHETSFPGFAALVPCLGTAALIYANSHRLTWTGRLIAAKPVVIVGLMSYSLYLWHWPILAYARHIAGMELPLVVSTGAIVATLACGWLSWRFVETPFRNGTVLSTNWRVLGGALAAPMVIITVSAAAIHTNGFPQRFPADAIAYREAVNSMSFVYQVSREEFRRGDVPVLGDQKARPTVMLWGDSHAMALAPGLNAACLEQGLGCFQATRSSTPPLLGFDCPLSRHGRNVNCPQWNRDVLNFAVKHNVETVILAGHWPNYANENSAFGPILEATIEKLHSHGIRVVIVKDVALQEGRVPTLLADAVISGTPVDRLGKDLTLHSQRHARCDAVFDQIAVRREASVIDPERFFSDDGVWRMAINNVAMYRDSHHLSIEGAMRLKPMFNELFEDLRPDITAKNQEEKQATRR